MLVYASPLSEMRNFHLAKNPKKHLPPSPTKFDYLTLDLQSFPEIRASSEMDLSLEFHYN